VSSPRTYIVADVFTDTPLQGNPVAVFLDGSGLSAELMQRTARELNLSETVFVLAAQTPDADARVRIFTPATELPFAGHPVLGTAFILARSAGVDTITLQTGSGLVRVALRRRGATVVYGEMEQPLPTWTAFEPVSELLSALRANAPTLPIEVYDNGARHVAVALSGIDTVAALRPDMGALLDLGAYGFSCFAVAEDHVRTRMFGPGLGVAEDPATGSAAGPVAVHLARHGRTAFGQRIELRQGEEIGRPSTLYACAEGSTERLQRVLVGGAAVEVARGEYRLPDGALG
jgi:trans-2,3-dihydro-3-hydroxyanthranilate isomerase